MGKTAEKSMKKSKKSAEKDAAARKEDNAAHKDNAGHKKKQRRASADEVSQEADSSPKTEVAQPRKVKQLFDDSDRESDSDGDKEASAGSLKKQKEQKGQKKQPKKDQKEDLETLQINKKYATKYNKVRDEIELARARAVLEDEDGEDAASYLLVSDCATY
jgi:hypothetical protein